MDKNPTSKMGFYFVVIHYCVQIDGKIAFIYFKIKRYKYTREKGEWYECFLKKLLFSYYKIISLIIHSMQLTTDFYLNT